MLKKTVIDFLNEALTESEIIELRKLNLIESSELRNEKLRSFFHNPLIFDKVKPTIDPAWLSYEIFINGKDYEF